VIVELVGEVGVAEFPTYTLTVGTKNKTFSTLSYQVCKGKSSQVYRQNAHQ